MGMQKKKFSSQASPEALAAMREIARSEGRQFQAVVQEAMEEYIVNRTRKSPPSRGDGTFPGQRRAKPTAV